MKKLNFTLVCKLVILLSLTFYRVSAQVKPNIILIMSDDQGWFDAGFNGNSIIQTPNLDSLAYQGIIFDRFYAGSPVCSPTRASLQTGRNPLRIEIPGANKGHLKTAEITIAELLKTKGYVTGHFGKWHLGTLTTKEKDANRGGKKGAENNFSIPSMHGYDVFFSTESKVPTYDPMIKPTKFKVGESLKYGWTATQSTDTVAAYGTAYWNGHEQKVTTDLEGDDSRVVMDRVIPFVQDAVANKTPFFTTIWLHTPHLPVVTSEYYKEKYSFLSEKKQLYYGAITAMDDQIGCLVEVLKEQGVADDTMIWFCSDNGPEKNTPGSAVPFKGRKRSLFEGGLRTPAFVTWCNGLNGGKRVKFPACTSDYLPTLAGVLEIEYPDDRPLDGKNIFPMLENDTLKRNKPIGFLYGNQLSWVSDKYKLISLNKGKTYKFYDLENDKEERYNILATETEKAIEMKSELDAWLKSVKRSAAGNDYK